MFLLCLVLLPESTETEKRAQERRPEPTETGPVNTAPGPRPEPAAPGAAAVALAPRWREADPWSLHRVSAAEPVLEAEAVALQQLLLLRIWVEQVEHRIL